MGALYTVGVGITDRRSSGGAIAAGHPVTAAAGADVLAAGGNAIDACIAAGAASWSAESTVTGIGGAGFLLAHDARTGETVAFDFFAAVPGIGWDRPRSPMHDVVLQFGGGTQLFHVGSASCAVPGIPAGLTAAHRRFGRMPWKELMLPAARLARDGIEVTAEHASLHTLLDGVMSYQPACAASFQPEGRPLREGELQYNAALADTIERLAENGADEFVTGETAQAIVEEMRSTGGSITAEDLASYEAIERTPLRVGFRGRELFLNPPPASGGALVAHTLAVLDRFAPIEDPWDLEGVVKLIGALRAAQAVRTPAFERALYDGTAGAMLLDDAAVQAGVVLAEQGGGHPLEPAGAPNTTHISVIDAAGNAASMTTTTGCGAGIFAGDTGVHLNNMLGETDLMVKSMELRPGARLTSMMTPMIGFRAGERRPSVTIGSSGSARLRSSIVQVLVHVFDHGLALDDATEYPRIHPQGAAIECEAGVPKHLMDELESRGEQIVRWPQRNGYFGGAQVVLEQDGALMAAGDPRRGGSGVVVGATS